MVGSVDDELAADLMAAVDKARCERDEAKAAVERLKAELADAKSHLLADEERRKLTGDALQAEGEAHELRAERDQIHRQLSALRSVVGDWGSALNVAFCPDTDLAKHFGVTDGKGWASFNNRGPLTLYEVIQRAHRMVRKLARDFERAWQERDQLRRELDIVMPENDRGWKEVHALRADLAALRAKHEALVEACTWSKVSVRDFDNAVRWAEKNGRLDIAALMNRIQAALQQQPEPAQASTPAPEVPPSGDVRYRHDVAGAGSSNSQPEAKPQLQWVPHPGSSVSGNCQLVDAESATFTKIGHIPSANGTCSICGAEKGAVGACPQQMKVSDLGLTHTPLVADPRFDELAAQQKRHEAALRELIKGAENGSQYSALEYSPRHHARLALAELEGKS